MGPALGLGVALQDLVDDEVAGKEGGLPVEDVLQHTRQRLDLRLRYKCVHLKLNVST